MWGLPGLRLGWDCLPILPILSLFFSVTLCATIESPQDFLIFSVTLCATIESPQDFLHILRDTMCHYRKSTGLSSYSPWHFVSLSKVHGFFFTTRCWNVGTSLTPHCGVEGCSLWSRRKWPWRLLPFKRGGCVKTITTENGTEFCEHEYITLKLGVQVYFTNPYCPCEKGCIENINMLYRQYLPRNPSFAQLSDHDILELRHVLNFRPRKKMGFELPSKKHYLSLHS